MHDDKTLNDILPNDTLPHAVPVVQSAEFGNAAGAFGTTVNGNAVTVVGMHMQNDHAVNVNAEMSDLARAVSVLHIGEIGRAHV